MCPFGMNKGWGWQGVFLFTEVVLKVFHRFKNNQQGKPKVVLKVSAGFKNNRKGASIKGGLMWRWKLRKYSDDRSISVFSF